jgi:hypothetical protein
MLKQEIKDLLAAHADNAAAAATIPYYEWGQWPELETGLLREVQQEWDGTARLLKALGIDPGFFPWHG